MIYKKLTLIYADRRVRNLTVHREGGGLYSTFPQHSPNPGLVKPYRFDFTEVLVRVILFILSYIFSLFTCAYTLLDVGNLRHFVSGLFIR